MQTSYRKGLNKKDACFLKHAQKVRVGRSAFSRLFCCKGDVVGKIGGKIRFAQQKVKNYKNSVFPSDLC